MTDLSSRLRRALDQVQPIDVNDIRNAASRRRTRRRRAGLSAAAVSGVAAIVVGVLALSGSRSTTVRTNPASGLPATSTTSPMSTPAQVTASLPRGAQVTSVIRYRNIEVAAGDDFPAGSDPVLPTCVQQGCNPVVWTSTDGSHWSVTWGAEATGSIAGETLVASPQRLLLFNADESTNLWESTDTITWHQVALPQAFSALLLRGVVYGHGRFVAISNNKYAGGPVTAYGQSDTVWTSTDGTAWTQAPVPGPAATFQSVEVEPSGFQISGVLQHGGGRATWTSTDGTSWSAPTQPTVPSAHGCPEYNQGDTVTVTLNPDGPLGSCFQVSGQQSLAVINSTNSYNQKGHPVTVRFDGYAPRQLAPGQRSAYTRTFASYLSPGPHTLLITFSGSNVIWNVVIWLQSP